MQVRCSYCQMMFPISREETLAALEHMAENDLKYYDAHCPNCRRANRVERFKLEASYPNWQADLKTMVKQADKAEAKEAAAPAGASQSGQTSAKASAAAKTQNKKKPSQEKELSPKTAPAKKPAAKTGPSKGKKK